jgi:nitrite reductase/ring-hydroxylating ferredoxin subunit
MLGKIKFKNISFLHLLGSQSKGYFKVAEQDELEINEMKALKLKGNQILLCRSERGYYALQIRCSHKNGLLTHGVMISSTIQCLNHGCQFDVPTGNVKRGPAKKALRKYEVFEKDGGIYIKL